MTKAQPEQDYVHRPIAQYLDLVCNTGGFWWTTFPGGGKRTKAEAAIFKGLGVKAGVADILIISDVGRAYWAECKTDNTAFTKKTYQKPPQEAFEAEMTKRMSDYVVVRSVDDMKAALIEWDLI